MISHTVDDEYSEFSQYYIDEHYSEVDPQFLDAVFGGNWGNSVSPRCYFHIKQSMLVVAILPNYLKSDSPVVKNTSFPAF